MPALTMKDLKKMYSSVTPEEAVESILTEVGVLRAAHRTSEQEKANLVQDATTSRARGVLTRKMKGIEKDIEMMEKALDHFCSLVVASTQQPTTEQPATPLQPPNVPPVLADASTATEPVKAAHQAPSVPPGFADVPTGDQPASPLQAPAVSSVLTKASTAAHQAPAAPPGLTKASTAAHQAPAVPPGLSKASTTAHQAPAVPPGLSKASTAAHQAPAAPPGLAKESITTPTSAQPVMSPITLNAANPSATPAPQAPTIWPMPTNASTLTGARQSAVGAVEKPPAPPSGAERVNSVGDTQSPPDASHSGTANESQGQGILERLHQVYGTVKR